MLMLFFLGAGWMQGIRVRDGLLEWERTTASSLLDQGVEKGVIAQAFSSTTATEDGSRLLQAIGHTRDHIPLLFSVSGQAVRSSEISLLTAGTVFAFLLIGGSVFYMRSLERRIKCAENTVGRYASGDFSERLTRGETGTFHRFLGKVDQLATELKAKSETEYEMKEFLKDTVADISHQLKTPLAALNMYVEIIASEPEKTETVKKFSEKAAVSLTRMERLIYLLLRMTRLDSGSVSFAVRPVRAAELAEMAAGDLLTRAEQERKRILFEGGKGIILECDPDWTAEALGNLIKNGLDHTEPGGTVRVTWRTSPAMVRICVEDNGTGIMPDDIHHIFKRFYRSSRSLDAQGIGLGLPLAKSIVEGQGGVISVQSVPGKGTVFTISFPHTDRAESFGLPEGKTGQKVTEL